MIPIVVACPEDYDRPAVRALRQEGLDPCPEPLVGDYAYGDMLRRWWHKGEGFVLVEADVVPWPGAVAKLWECGEPWCAHEYPHGEGQLAAALGCTKFSVELVRAHPDLPDKWLIDPWPKLDGVLISALWEVLGESWHVHVPAVAHARERSDAPVPRPVGPR